MVMCYPFPAAPGCFHPLHHCLAPSNVPSLQEGHPSAKMALQGQFMQGMNHLEPPSLCCPLDSLCYPLSLDLLGEVLDLTVPIPLLFSL